MTEIPQLRTRGVPTKICPDPCCQSWRSWPGSYFHLTGPGTWDPSLCWPESSHPSWSLFFRLQRSKSGNAKSKDPTSGFPGSKQAHWGWGPLGCAVGGQLSLPQDHRFAAWHWPSPLPPHTLKSRLHVPVPRTASEGGALLILRALLSVLFLKFISYTAVAEQRDLGESLLFGGYSILHRCPNTCYSLFRTFFRFYYNIFLKAGLHWLKWFQVIINGVWSHTASINLIFPDTWYSPGVIGLRALRWCLRFLQWNSAEV